MPSSSRVFGLDLMRALAVLFVVYGHGYYVVPHVSFALYSIPMVDGVAIFFVLSGFLIGRILLQTIAHDDLTHRSLFLFWSRRWLRTLPNYVLVLSVLAVVFTAMGESPPQLLRYFLFTQNLASPPPPFFQESWSLAVEEWFYLLIPILFFIAAKFKRRQWIPVVIVSVIVAVTVFRAYRAFHSDFTTLEDWYSALGKQVITRFDSLIFGVAGAYTSLTYPEGWKRWARPALMIGLALFVSDKLLMASDFYRNYVHFTLIALAATLVLPAASAWTVQKGCLAAVATFFSLTSYSLYLLNLTPVQHLVLPHLGCCDSAVLRYVVYWTCSVSLAALLYYGFERRILRVRDSLCAR